MNESQILYETEYFWVAKKRGRFEIMLKGDSCSYVVGEKFGLQGAKDFICKMEKYPQNIKHLFPKK